VSHSPAPGVSSPPPRAVSILVAVALVAIWGVVRLVVFADTVLPLTYVLPLFVCVWTRDRHMLWAMAAAFAAMHSYQSGWMLEMGPSPARDTAVWIATLLNIAIGASAVHVIIGLRGWLESSVARVRAQAATLQAQGEELTEQNERLAEQSEELAQQTEELSAQLEELTQQNEEIQAQSEEIQHLMDEITHREHLLQQLLDVARDSHRRAEALERISSAAMALCGPDLSAAAIYRVDEGHLSILAATCPVQQGHDDPMPDAFVQLTIEQGRPAALGDVTLRPDLPLLRAPGNEPFRAVLAAPITTDGRVFGAIAAYAHDLREWTDEQFRLIEWLAQQAGGILETLNAQRELRRQTALIDLSPVAIMIRRSDGTITEWGGGAHTLYGWSREEAIGRRSHELLKAQFLQGHAAISRALESTGRWTGELTHTTKDGRELTVESHWLAQRDDDGTITEVLESDVDVTARVEAVRALHEANRNKNEFLATLAHELRNPLAPIRTSIGILRARGLADPILARCRDVIDRQAAHMARLLDDLLDVSRLSHGKLTLQRARTSLNDIIDAAIEVSRPMIDQGRHALVVEPLPQPILLHADPARLTQVLGNLLHNAAKYSDPGSEIRISVQQDGQTVLVSVRDHGIGISSELLEDVFDLFTQGDGARERGQGGLGIGLSLARRLVEMHGGTIEAASPGQGQGSVFTVRLPMMQYEDVQAVPSPIELSHPPSPVKCKVLVADDSADAAEMVATLLRHQGCEVRTARDGAEAAREAEHFHPDLILLDIGMPLMNGYDACRLIRAQPWSNGTRIVALTGWGQDGDRQQSELAGFDRHLVKPIDPDTLIQLVRELPRFTEATDPSRAAVTD
jgi:PAS domain S-box-containing protein